MPGKRLLKFLSYYLPINGLIFLIMCNLSGCFFIKANHKDPRDPYEKYNRKVFKFNQKFDKVIYRPVAKLYDTAVPPQYNYFIHNFFSNLSELPTVANDLLQADFRHAISDSWRFVINSTIGILGFVDVAKHIGIVERHNDFGITMTKWGATKPAYLVIPFLGPGTWRDSLGFVVDYMSFTIYPHVRPIYRYSLNGLQLVQKRADLLPADKIVDEAFDPYVLVRNAYFQKRNQHINKILGIESAEDTYVEGDEDLDDNDPYVEDVAE